MDYKTMLNYYFKQDDIATSTVTITSTVRPNYPPDFYYGVYSFGDDFQYKMEFGYDSIEAPNQADNAHLASCTGDGCKQSCFAKQYKSSFERGYTSKHPDYGMIHHTYNPNGGSLQDYVDMNSDHRHYDWSWRRHPKVAALYDKEDGDNTNANNYDANPSSEDDKGCLLPAGRFDGVAGHKNALLAADNVHCPGENKVSMVQLAKGCTVDLCPTSPTPTDTSKSHCFRVGPGPGVFKASDGHFDSDTMYEAHVYCHINNPEGTMSSFADNADGSGAKCSLPIGRYGNSWVSTCHPNKILTGDIHVGSDPLHGPCPVNDKVSQIVVKAGCAAHVFQHCDGISGNSNPAVDNAAVWYIKGNQNTPATFTGSPGTENIAMRAFRDNDASDVMLFCPDVPRASDVTDSSKQEVAGVSYQLKGSFSLSDCGRACLTLGKDCLGYHQQVYDKTNRRYTNYKADQLAPCILRLTQTSIEPETKLLSTKKVFGMPDAVTNSWIDSAFGAIDNKLQEETPKLQIKHKQKDASIGGRKEAVAYGGSEATDFFDMCYTKMDGETLSAAEQKEIYSLTGTSDYSVYESIARNGPCSYSSNAAGIWKARFTPAFATPFQIHSDFKEFCYGTCNKFSSCAGISFSERPPDVHGKYGCDLIFEGQLPPDSELPVSDFFAVVWTKEASLNSLLIDSSASSTDSVIRPQVASPVPPLMTSGQWFCVAKKTTGAAAGSSPQYLRSRGMHALGATRFKKITKEPASSTADASTCLSKSLFHPDQLPSSPKAIDVIELEILGSEISLDRCLYTCELKKHEDPTVGNCKAVVYRSSDETCVLAWLLKNAGTVAVETFTKAMQQAIRDQAPFSVGLSAFVRRAPELLVSLPQMNSDVLRPSFSGYDNLFNQILTATFNRAETEPLSLLPHLDFLNLPGGNTSFKSIRLVQERMRIRTRFLLPLIPGTLSTNLVATAPSNSPQSLDYLLDLIRPAVQKAVVINLRGSHDSLGPNGAYSDLFQDLSPGNITVSVYSIPDLYKKSKQLPSTAIPANHADSVLVEISVPLAVDFTNPNLANLTDAQELSDLKQNIADMLTPSSADSASTNTTGSGSTTTSTMFTEVLPIQLSFAGVPVSEPLFATGSGADADEMVLNKYSKAVLTELVAPNADGTSTSLGFTLPPNKVSSAVQPIVSSTEASNVKFIRSKLRLNVSFRGKQFKDWVQNAIATKLQEEVDFCASTTNVNSDDVETQKQTKNFYFAKKLQQEIAAGGLDKSEIPKIKKENVIVFEQISSAARGAKTLDFEILVKIEESEAVNAVSSLVLSLLSSKDSEESYTFGPNSVSNFGKELKDFLISTKNTYFSQSYGGALKGVSLPSMAQASPTAKNLRFSFDFSLDATNSASLSDAEINEKVTNLAKAALATAIYRGTGIWLMPAQISLYFLENSITPFKSPVFQLTIPATKPKLQWFLAFQLEKFVTDYVAVELNALTATVPGTTASVESCGILAQRLGYTDTSAPNSKPFSCDSWKQIVSYTADSAKIKPYTKSSSYVAADPGVLEDDPVVSTGTVTTTLAGSGTAAPVIPPTTRIMQQVVGFTLTLPLDAPSADGKVLQPTSIQVLQNWVEHVIKQEAGRILASDTAVESSLQKPDGSKGDISLQIPTTGITVAVESASETKVTTPAPCQLYEPGSAVPGKWELYMYKHGEVIENNGWRDMRYGQNPNGLNSLCPHPTSGNAKMAEATFDQICYKEVLAVGGTGAWVRIKRKDNGCIPAAHAFGPGEHSINGQYSMVTSSGFSGDAKVGPVNHGPLFSDAMGGGQWMWRCNKKPGMQYDAENCASYDTGGVLGNSFSDPNTWGNLISMPGMYDAGKGEANCCKKGYSWAWYGKTTTATDVRPAFSGVLGMQIINATFLVSIPVDMVVESSSSSTSAAGSSGSGSTGAASSSTTTAAILDVKQLEQTFSAVAKAIKEKLPAGVETALTNTYKLGLRKEEIEFLNDPVPAGDSFVSTEPAGSSISPTTGQSAASPTFVEGKLKFSTHRGVYNKDISPEAAMELEEKLLKEALQIAIQKAVKRTVLKEELRQSDPLAIEESNFEQPAVQISPPSSVRVVKEERTATVLFHGYYSSDIVGELLAGFSDSPNSNQTALVQAIANEFAKEVQNPTTPTTAKIGVSKIGLKENSSASIVSQTKFSLKVKAPQKTTAYLLSTVFQNSPSVLQLEHAVAKAVASSFRSAVGAFDESVLSAEHVSVTLNPDQVPGIDSEVEFTCSVPFGDPVTSEEVLNVESNHPYSVKFKQDLLNNVKQNFITLKPVDPNPNIIAGAASLYSEQQIQSNVKQGSVQTTSFASNRMHLDVLSEKAQLDRLSLTAIVKTSAAKAMVEALA
ncbi:unnamed protein product, partial [Amoebophrya sp. A120]|eukprot:GSA120T00010155001.1